jgi:hypothetical protein
MNKKTSKHKKGSTPQKNKRRTAPRIKKINEVSSDTLQSSLTANVTLAPPEENASERAGQAGDVQGISNIAEADPESVEELLDDGQALEAEVVSGVEDAPDEREVPARGRIEDEPAHPFEERNKI